MQAQAIHGRIFVAVTILAVSDDRVPDALHVNTNLVGAPRLEIEFEERKREVCGGDGLFEYLVVGDRHLTAVIGG